MKAISFFCLVFVSMLTAFLIATGEVTRWFSGDEERKQLVFNPPPASPSDSPNMLYFPFYNVELGKLSFTIRAELSQDDLAVKDKFDEIRHLTLRNGSLDIPVYDGLALGSTPAEKKDGGDPAGDGEGAQQITLTFETAEWQRPPATAGSSRDGMKVALTNGRGTTEDGFEFFFDELLFVYRSAGEEDSYEVSSDRPVSIKNQAFELHSPSGLRGKLRGDGIGLESLTFLPPVTATIDRKRAPFFQYVTRVETPADGKPRIGGETKRGRTDAGKDGGKDDQGVNRVVITSQGRLDLRALQPKEDEARRTVIAFHDDVVIRPETGGDRGGRELRDAVQTRFECQYLELAFREVANRLVPDRALATWEEGRVKAYFEQKGKEGYVVDGDRLEWIYQPPPEGSKDGAAGPGVSQAILHGNPTMTGKGSRFVARQALLDLSEGRVLLDQVSGRFRMRRSETRRGAQSGGRAIDPLGGVDGRREQERDTATLPEHWDMTSPEVEFFFDDSAGEGQRLSHFIARSDRPGEVVVASAPDESPNPEGDPGDEISGLRLTASHVTYRTAEKMITFEGTDEVKPDFSQGENRIEARRIRLLLEKNEELAVFEDEVRARIVDTDRLAAVTGSDVRSGGDADKTAEQPGKRERDSRKKQAGRGPDGPVELSAALLTAGLDEDGQDISFLRAKGSDGAPARIHSTTGNHFVIEGAELEWNRREETAIVWGSAPGAADAEGEPVGAVARSSNTPATGDPAPPPLALLEFEGGQLLAKSISFDQKNQTAYLETHVVLECREGSTSVAVHTGRAEVEFFEKEPAESAAKSGILRDLRKVKAFRAHRSEASPIELIGEHFRAYADDAVWDATTSELRFLGGDKQEIRISNDHFKGPIFAREVVYSVKDDLLTLRGEVQGQLTQRLSHGEQKDSDQPMEWRFETSRLELQLHESPQTGRPELHSLRAREWVHLTSTKEDVALRLLGDALDYDASSGKVTVFSPAGRPQTFFRMDPAALAAIDPRGAAARTPAGVNRDEIIAQRILLLPVEYPDARFGESRSWLNVVFEQNVKAVFRPPKKGRRNTSSTRLSRVPTNEPWKLDTEKLIVRVDPGQAPAGMVTWATAHGNVIFKLGVYTATGNRAEYQDKTQTVVLTGDPARISGQDSQGRPYTRPNERITIRRDGDHVDIQLDSRRTRSKGP